MRETKGYKIQKLGSKLYKITTDLGVEVSVNLVKRKKKENIESITDIKTPNMSAPLPTESVTDNVPVASEINTTVPEPSTVTEAPVAEDMATPTKVPEPSMEAPAPPTPTQTPAA